MHHRSINPLTGWPTTTCTFTNDAQSLYSIVIRGLTPDRARLADRAGRISAFLIYALGAYVLLTQHRFTLELCIAVLLACFLGHLAVKPFLIPCLSQTTEIVMTADTIMVRCWGAWRMYNRLLPHQYALLIHDRAEQEARDLDYASRKASANGTVLRPIPYYGQSFHVVLIYAGQRVDLLEMFGQSKAVAVVARLQLVDRLLNESISMAGGFKATPESEWSEAPGSAS